MGNYFNNTIMKLYKLAVLASAVSAAGECTWVTSTDAVEASLAEEDLATFADATTADACSTAIEEDALCVVGSVGMFTAAVADDADTAEVDETEAAYCGCVAKLDDAEDSAFEAAESGDYNICVLAEAAAAKLAMTAAAAALAVAALY